jgi:phospholipid-binding lipoprotein MlaA
MERIACRQYAFFVIIPRRHRLARHQTRGSSMLIRRSPLVLSAIFVIGVAVSGCVAPGASAPGEEAFNDPLEDTNRQIFAFNQEVDQNVLVPVAEAYRNTVPPPMRQSVHDFLQNLNHPIIFANDVLQGQPGLAADTLGRFVINTTVGVGGMFDVATRAGIPYHSNDLGVTLATYGFDSGPYLVVPVLGPSNVRDLVGQVGDGFGDPGNYFAGQYHKFYATLARTVTEGIDTRSRNIESLADIERTSLDYYATIRSLYNQRRAAQIRHEQSNLPNPGFGGDSYSGPPLTYTAPPPR